MLQIFVSIFSQLLASLFFQFCFVEAMADPYDTGHDQGCDYESNNSFSISVHNYDCTQGFQQQQTFATQDNISPMTRPRHDSVNSHVSPLSLHQAEHQPCALQLTPHMSPVNPRQSVAMSRGTSYASYRSSASSGQQYGGVPQSVSQRSYPNIHSPFGVDMRRSHSAFSANSALHSHPTSPLFGVPPLYPPPDNDYSPGASNGFTAGFSTATQTSPMNASVNEAILGYELTGLGEFGHIGSGLFDYGSFEQALAPTLSTQPIHRRPNSFGGYVERPEYQTHDSASQIKVQPVEAAVNSIPVQSPLLEQRKKRRPRQRSPPSNSESEHVTGHVLASGQFKCSDPDCDELRFGRQADFKRHFVNAHADKIIEFFCPVQGCERSSKPAKKSKGRSFKGRKDKMEEHVQAVHNKASKKRGRSYESESEGGEDTEDAEQPLSKARRQS
ncbi:hypothetical protein OPT61_g6025 [Boeremia exigua]|uniref:Uncharacterized protein n=1 Tax=Boeremia exigua TaxID=749465 RepID=A0ACC2I851_9PLEO|nr:hypothetical protein OPT61_g6025 [Boeremia exigua]